MREFIEGEVVQVIGTVKGSECRKANEVLPWRVVRLGMPLPDIGADRS
jgi:hypothetical protein